MSSNERQDVALLETIKARLPEIEALLATVSTMWGYEDGIYRFYHQSFKVYHLQGMTEIIVALLKDLAGPRNMDSRFLNIVNDGTGKVFRDSHNKKWGRHCRPIVEAFFHARFFLEMIAKYGKSLDVAPNILPSGWAAVLELYNIR